MTLEGGTCKGSLQESTNSKCLAGSIYIVQELCESQGRRPGPSVLTSLLVSVDISYIEPCFGIGHSLSLICQLTSEDIKHHFIITMDPFSVGNMPICFHHNTFFLKFSFSCFYLTVTRSMIFFSRTCLDITIMVDWA